ncbi:hypothetical protein Sme01_49020 [Sphaerisporangium melleum]|uniref:Uncharacterized protein n=1 Tax=Sphaerisporangium melleum TaxID=321316 RepID=A0A917R3X8_9ACTN|nr:hypothetical protein [Sphaerisporangium melleum]GGK87604.1 hypothetical protein GCM10007964_32710 [Sphaerisporangium melleum]GII72426.1 hypothetical protein Sme01_49020 [Sphaerisporangium melleum]
MTLPSLHDGPAGAGSRPFPVAIRRAAGTTPRRLLIAITLLLGLLPAVAIVAAAPPADITLAALVLPVQSLMSVTVPLIGILLAGDLRRLPGTPPLAPTMAAAAVPAALIGAFGSAVCAIALALVPATAPDPWRGAPVVLIGGVLVQVVAQLIGIGLGLLLRSPAVAFVASLAPAGLWWALGTVEVLRPLQAFTPYATVVNLLSGRMSAAAWGQWLAVLLIWVAGLNAAGAALLARRRTSAVKTAG